MRNIPVALVYLRVLIGVFILLAGALDLEVPAPVMVTLFAAGLLSDILDGIIARRLGVSTERLRRLDSTADQVFWICVAVGVLVDAPLFVKSNYLQIIILVAVEAVAYLICYLRFRKEVATHAISSKAWTLVLFATIVELMISQESSLLWQVCFYLGIVTRLEIIAIIFLLRQWTNDVPSVYHAWLLRQGKSIRRNKLFNG